METETATDACPVLRAAPGRAAAGAPSSHALSTPRNPHVQAHVGSATACKMPHAACQFREGTRAEGTLGWLRGGIGGAAALRRPPPVGALSWRPGVCWHTCWLYRPCLLLMSIAAAALLLGCWARGSFLGGVRARVLWGVGVGQKDVCVTRSDKDNAVLDTLVGRKITKHFAGFGTFLGTISPRTGGNNFVAVYYEDGDAEEMWLDEVLNTLAPAATGTEGKSVPSKSANGRGGGKGLSSMLSDDEEAEAGTDGSAADVYRPFAETLLFARTLKLTSRAAWRVWCKSGAKPEHVPVDPDAEYSDDGWEGWPHWLGYGANAPSNAPAKRGKKAAALATVRLAATRAAA